MAYGSIDGRRRLKLTGAEIFGNTIEAATYFADDCAPHISKATSSAFAVTTYAYGGDGLRRSYQKPGQPVRTMVWDGSKYLGEI